MLTENQKKKLIQVNNNEKVLSLNREEDLMLVRDYIKNNPDRVSTADLKLKKELIVSKNKDVSSTALSKMYMRGLVTAQFVVNYVYENTISKNAK